MFTQGPEVTDKIYLNPAGTRKNVVNLQYKEDGKYTYTWDFVTLSNGNTIVIRNNMAYLFKDLSEPPIATKKVIDEAGHCYSIKFLEDRLFLVSGSNTIEVDPNTLDSKFYDDTRDALIYLSESEKAYILPGPGTCWVVSNKNSKEEKIQLDENKKEQAISLKKISNECLALLTSLEENATITLWKKSGNKWKQALSESFMLPNNLCHHVLYPSNDLMLILSIGKTETRVTPIELKSLKVHEPWVFNCSFPEDDYFKNLSLPGKDTNSTFDPGTIVFYKQNMSGFPDPMTNLYYLDLANRSLRILKLETGAHVLNRISAISHDEIYLAFNSSAHIIDGDFSISRLKIPKTLSTATAFEMVSSTTKIFDVLVPTILDYANNDFHLSCPLKDTIQNPDEAKLQVINVAKENESREEMIKQKKCEEEKLNEEHRIKLEEQKRQFELYCTSVDSILKKFSNNKIVEEDEYQSFLQHCESIKKLYMNEIDIKPTESFITERYEDQKHPKVFQFVI